MLEEPWAAEEGRVLRKPKSMGKKRVIKQTTEEVLKEKEAREVSAKKKKEIKGKRLDKANIYI